VILRKDDTKSVTMSILVCGFPAHRRSQGVQWVQLHPQSGEKNRRNLQGKFVSAPPGRAKVNFRTFCGAGEIWRAGVVHLVVLASFEGED